MANSFLKVSMVRANKSLALIIIVIVFVSSLSLIMVKPAYAQTPTPTPTPSPSPTPVITPTPPPSHYTTPTPAATSTPLPTSSPSPDVSQIFKPSVQEFKLYLVNQPYQIPATTPTYTTDPYTGETKLQNPGSSGYQVDNWTIQLWIPNMQFNYPNDSNTYHLYCDVRTKGHFEQNWQELDPPFNGLHSGSYSDSGAFIGNSCPAQSNNVYTVITYSAYSSPYYSYPQTTYPPNATVDFQVSAILGHNSQIFIDDHPGIPQLIGHQEPAISYDIQSDWSDTQTITISNSSISTSTPQNPTVSTPFAIPISIPTQTSTSTPTQSPTLTAIPTVPEFPSTILLITLLIATTLLGTVLIKRKHSKRLLGYQSF